jgi:hypothetical protein
MGRVDYERVCCTQKCSEVFDRHPVFEDAIRPLLCSAALSLGRARCRQSHRERLKGANGAGLGGDVAVGTDGELSGLNHGLVVGQVMPEAAGGGPLAGLQDGDLVSIDLDARRLDARPVRDGDPVRATGQNPERGWLGQYAALVGPIQSGAVLRRPSD